MILIFPLASCTKDIPEGDIKDFVDAIDYNKTFEYVTSAKGITEVGYYENKVLKGSIKTTTIIDKNITSYSYILGEIGGIYVGNEQGQYPFSKRETLCYMDELDNAYVFEKTDGKLNPDLKYRPEDVYLSVKNFFYTEQEANFHQGGYYYGDYVKVNCARYYEYFSLNEDKTLLTYAINTLTQNKEKEDILTLHKFTINKYGLITELSTTAKNNAKGLMSKTTMLCEYNIEVERLESLEEENV